MANTGSLTYAQIMGYWNLAGGDPNVASTMAAIAFAESSGDPGSIQQGTSYCGSGSDKTGWGLWQITCGDSVPQIGIDYDLLDPLTNARAAVAKYNASFARNANGFLPWSTYTSGAYRRHLQVPVPLPATVSDPGQWTPTGPAPAGTHNSSAVGSATAPPTTSTAGTATGTVVPFPAAPTIVAPFAPQPGLGTLNVPDILINGGPLRLDTRNAVTDVIVERSIGNASTVTVQLDDPQRSILRSGIFSQGDILTLNNLNFVLVQFAKASDQLQLTFEAEGVYLLRQQMNPVDSTGTSTGTQATNTYDLSGFAWTLIKEVQGLGFVGETDAFAQADGTFQGSNTGGVQIGRGTSSDPQEDSWTCLVRIATTAGWRVWESAGTIYFGSDEFWLQYFSSAGTLQEFTDQALNIDFDWDSGKPMGNATVTAITELWPYPPGNPVTLRGMGPANGNWLVYDMQRDLYNPQATITLTTPMSPPALISNTQGQTQAVTSSGTPGTPGVDPGSPQSGTPLLTVTISPGTTLNPGQAFTVNCLVSGQGYGVTPTGTVTFFANGANDAWGTNVPLVNGVATATVQRGWGPGNYAIYADYTPDKSSKWQENNTQNELLLVTVQQQG